MGLFDRFRKKKDETVTPGGSPIYRYEETGDESLHIPQQSGVYAEEIEAHFEALFPGRESRVLHEIVSDIVHVDVHVMWPSKEQNFFVLYTTGMSDLPMTLDSEIPAETRKKLELAELYLFLPGDWPLSPDSVPPENAYWPIRTMKFMARFPHQYCTWLGWGHTMPNGPEYTPLDDSVGFGGVVFSGGGDGKLGGFTARDGRRINLLFMIPAYKEEIEYKLKYGMEKLDEVFQEKDLPMVLDPQRPNLCPDFHEVLDS